jgi:hypothetical protein
MLSMHKETSLGPRDARERVMDFIRNQGDLEVVEGLVHLHGDQGAIEVRAVGDPLPETDHQVSQEALLSLADRVEKDSGLTRVHKMLHLHPRNREAGHMVVRIEHSKPTRVDADCQELEPVLRSLMVELPTA